MTTQIAPERPHAPTPDRPPLARIEDSEHEIVNGQIVESTPMGVWECFLASKISTQLATYVQHQKLGRAIAENLFILRRDPLLFRRDGQVRVHLPRRLVAGDGATAPVSLEHDGFERLLTKTLRRKPRITVDRPGPVPWLAEVDLYAVAEQPGEKLLKV